MASKATERPKTESGESPGEVKCKSAEQSCHGGWKGCSSIPPDLRRKDNARTEAGILGILSALGILEAGRRRLAGTGTDASASNPTLIPTLQRSNGPLVGVWCTRGAIAEVCW